MPASSLVAGVDEAGRGSLAGPVVAAAVILRQDVVLPGLADSKLLPAAIRSRLAEAIQAAATSWAVAAVEAADQERVDGPQESREGLAGTGRRRNQRITTRRDRRPAARLRRRRRPEAFREPLRDERVEEGEGHGKSQPMV
jgi:ribonuclease HII